MLKTSVLSEFRGSELGDKRLDRRLEQIVEQVERAPSESFPVLMGTTAEREGLYLANDLVLLAANQSQMHFVLRANPLSFVEPVEYPEGVTLQGLLPTGRGTWLTSDYVRGRFQLWRPDGS